MSRPVTARRKVWWRFWLIASSSLLTLGQALDGDWLAAVGFAALGGVSLAIASLLSWENERLQVKLMQHRVRRLMDDIVSAPAAEGDQCPPGVLHFHLHPVEISSPDKDQLEAILANAIRNGRGGAR